MVKVKICGIQSENDIRTVIEAGGDYVGFVLNYPKSHRNLDIAQARRFVAMLPSSVKSVAVVVSPTLWQVDEIARAGFDYIQIHGKLEKEILKSIRLPIFRAYNLDDGGDIKEIFDTGEIAGVVLDGKVPGSGESFPWRRAAEIDRKGKVLMLAGGLTPDNVADAIRIVKPDIVDVSSGVEAEDRKSKDKEKIIKFIINAKSSERR